MATSPNNIATIFDLPSIDVLAQAYRDYVTSQNTAVNPNIEDSDFYLKSIGLAGLISGAIGDAAINFINIFPQYLNGSYINLGLAARDLPMQQAATYAQANLGTVTAPAATFTVQAGMQLTNSVTNVVYEILNTMTINISDPASYNNIPAICTVAGAGNQLAPSTVLTFSNPPLDVDSNPVETLTVQNSTDGVNAETDNEAVTRIVNGTQIPKSGSRITDYYYYILDGNLYLPDNAIVITNAITIPNNQFNSANFDFGLFGVGGSAITDYTLNQGILYGISPGTYTPFDRSISDDAITAIQQSVTAQQLININPYINSITTQNLPTTESMVVTPYFQITVTLYPGLTLGTVLQINSSDQNGNPIVISMTVENLIKREVRRAICQQPFGATQTLDESGAIVTSQILLSSIEQQLDSALGTGQYQGTYATILIDRQVFIWQSGTGGGAVYGYTNIPVDIGIPNPPPSPMIDYPLAWIYDIADDPSIGYDNILVVPT